VTFFLDAVMTLRSGGGGSSSVTELPLTPSVPLLFHACCKLIFPVVIFSPFDLPNPLSFICCTELAARLPE
jgi:hypothetical protein